MYSKSYRVAHCASWNLQEAVDSLMLSVSPRGACSGTSLASLHFIGCFLATVPPSQFFRIPSSWCRSSSWPTPSCWWGLLLCGGHRSSFDREHWVFCNWVRWSSFPHWLYYPCGWFFNWGWSCPIRIFVFLPQHLPLFGWQLPMYCIALRSLSA